MAHVERGVLIMKNGKAWGKLWADGQASEYGWMAPEKAPLHDARYLKLPTDVVGPSETHYRRELADAQIVPVERATTVIVLEGLP